MRTSNRAAMQISDRSDERAAARRHGERRYLVRSSTSSGSMRTSNRAAMQISDRSDERAAARRHGELLLVPIEHQQRIDAHVEPRRDADQRPQR